MKSLDSKYVVTLRDIAKSAGCSVNTVSLALKNSPRISVNKKEHIIRIAREMDYLPNNVARSLVLGKSCAIGLVLGNINSNILISEASHIEHLLTQMGYSMNIVTSQGNVETETRALNLMLSNKVDGIIFNTNYRQNISRLEKLRKSGFPIVLISGLLGERVAIDAVYPDLCEGSYLATKHLINLGHKRIGYVCNAINVQDAVYKNKKAIGFIRAIEEAGIKFSMDMVFPIQIEYSNEQKAKGFHIHGNLLEKTGLVSAFFIGEDEIAIPVMKYLIENGVKIPDDVAIVSMDNTKYAESAIIGLTSVGFDTFEITRQAVDILLRIIQGNDMGKLFIDRSFPPSIYIRASCGGRMEQSERV